MSRSSHFPDPQLVESHFVDGLVGLMRRATQGFIQSPQDIMRQIDIEIPADIASAFTDLERTFKLVDWLPWFLGRSGAPDNDLLQASLLSSSIFFVPNDLQDHCFRARLLVRACTGSYHVPAQRIKVFIIISLAAL